MFSKLMKYEWKSYTKSMFFILIATAAITLLGVVSIATFDADFFNINDWVRFVSLSTYIGIFLLYYFGIIAISLAALLIIAIRFYKTMFTDEAYLTHTLPVTRSQLYWSKFLIAYGYYLFTTLMIILSAVVVFSTLYIRISSFSEFIDDFSSICSQIVDDIGIVALTLYIIFYIFLTLISIFTALVTVFASITLGQLFVKHRIIGSIIAYFIITFIMQVITFGLNFISSFIATGLMNFELLSLPYYNTYYFFICAFNVVVGIVLSIITLSQLKNNLNLE